MNDYLLICYQLFVFVNEATVQKYKADLTEEIEPQILELISRAKKGMKVLERRHHALKTKVRGVVYLEEFIPEVKRQGRTCPCC